MNAERLLLLADHMDTVDPSLFFLEDWKCGTAACAVGHACTIPSFQKAGLTLTPAILNGKASGTPTFLMHHGWRAVQKFFDLTAIETSELFSSESYEKNALPSDVAEKIRAIYS